jgi:predicted DNA-binding transcriptional regulator AlpA
MVSAGKLPPPLYLGRNVRWREQDIDHWIANGCPEQENRVK